MEPMLQEPLQERAALEQECAALEQERAALVLRKEQELLEPVRRKQEQLHNRNLPKHIQLIRSHSLGQHCHLGIRHPKVRIHQKHIQLIRSHSLGQHCRLGIHQKHIRRRSQQGHKHNQCRKKP